MTYCRADPRRRRGRLRRPSQKDRGKAGDRTEEKNLMHLTKPLSAFTSSSWEGTREGTTLNSEGERGGVCPNWQNSESTSERAILNSEQSTELETAIQPEDEEGLFVP